jgi:hypothetical protein
MMNKPNIPNRSIEERLWVLERTVSLLARAFTVQGNHYRVLALQDVLEGKGVLGGPEVQARMQEISEILKLEAEHSDDPEMKRFRELRDFEGRLDP